MNKPSFRWKMALLLFMSADLMAQSHFVQSENKDFWFTGVHFVDDDLYPSESIDSEMLRVIYCCKNQLTGVVGTRMETTMMLQIGRNKSRFLSEGRFKADSLFSLRPRNPLAAAKYYSKENVLFFYDSYILEYQTSFLEFTGRLAADDFRYEDHLPEIEWTIQDSTEMICGYICKQATGSFRGRTYKVYYTEELPVSAGPWKLRGLPGLILDARDTDGICSFNAIAVQRCAGDIHRTKYPYITVSRREYERLQQQLYLYYYEFVNSHISRSKILSIGSQEFARPRKLVPMEMLEKD